MQDVRWKQRFDNFKKSFALLEQAVNIKNPDVVQRAGLVQFFEVCFELAWKVMKDYLWEEGFLQVKTPREMIKKCFEIGLIENGEEWLQALGDRNLSAQTYEEQTAQEIENLIRKRYFALLRELKEFFEKK